MSRRGFPGAGAVAADAAAGDWLVAVRGAVNGDRPTVRVDPRITLLDTLRAKLEVTGTETGCDRGQWGACTVHVDGLRSPFRLDLGARTLRETALSIAAGIVAHRRPGTGAALRPGGPSTSPPSRWRVPFPAVRSQDDRLSSRA